MSDLYQPLPSLDGEHCARCGRPLCQDSLAQVTQPTSGVSVLVCPECADVLAQSPLVHVEGLATVS